MTYEEHFEHILPQFLGPTQTVRTLSGLSIRANGTSWAGFHEAFKGEDGTELVIGEHSDIEISFSEEVEQLQLEFYVVSDLSYDSAHMLLDIDDDNFDVALAPLHNFYWLTISGSGYTESLPGPIATQPQRHLIVGPFRRMTISTSQAGTVHIRRLEWSRTSRH